MTTTVRFGPGGDLTDGGHKVYLRRNWADTWTYYPNLHCTEATWTCAPSMPTAQIVWPYGMIKSYTTNVYVQMAKLEVSRWYVKIVFTTDYVTNETVTWYGVVSDVEDEQAGLVEYAGTKRSSGQQIMSCLGMEQLLNQTDISSSWYSPDFGNPAKESPVVQIFNANGVGNRGFDAITLVSVFEGDPLFLGFLTAPWSTRDIVRYLLYWKGPSKSTVSHIRLVPFALKHEERLDDSDAPVLPQEGAKPLQLLYRLIDRRRLRSFYMEVDESTTPATVYLVPFTFAGSLIDFSLPEVDNIPQNTSKIAIIADEDEITSVSVRTVDFLKVDRVIARGARRTTTCTMFHTADRFEAAWTSADETTYEAGASGVTGYSGWDAQKKQLRNQEVRTQEALRKVYSWFQIPDDWNNKVGLYSSGTLTYDAFTDDVGSPVDQYARGISVLPFLPLYEGVDYSGTKVSDGTFDDPDVYAYRRPFCLFKRPTDGRWVIGERMSQLAEGDCDPTSDGNNTRWSAYVRTQPDTKIVEVHVTGEPQHVIAQTDFTPLAADRDVGDYDYKDREMLVTLTLQENRYAEGSYPAAGASDTTLIDAQRGLVIWAGDEFRQDYVADGTVVDVDNDGVPEIVAINGFVRDDTQRLDIIARLAYEWYARTRSVLTLATRRLTADVSVGDFVVSSGDSAIAGNTHYVEINSPITQITIRNPRMPEGSLETPTMTLITSAGEMDAVTLVPPPPR